MNETGCRTIIVNGVEDHFHCFVGLKPKNSSAEWMQSVKAKSFSLINNNHPVKSRFVWQAGFGVFSYIHLHMENVYQYILNQELHHETKTCREGYLSFLEKFGVPCDERYTFSPGLKISVIRIRNKQN